MLCIILEYLSTFLKVEFFAANMTMKCCVKDVKRLSRNASCTIVITEGELKPNQRFDQQKCVFINITEALYLNDNFSYEAHIDGDPDICYKIKHNGNKGSILLIN